MTNIAYFVEIYYFLVPRKFWIFYITCTNTKTITTKKRLFCRALCQQHVKMGGCRNGAGGAAVRVDGPGLMARFEHDVKLHNIRKIFESKSTQLKRSLQNQEMPLLLQTDHQSC